MKPVVLQSTATVNGGGVLIPFTLNEKLNFIVNDSSDFDLEINFDATVDQSGTFTLKVGETLSDVNMSCTTIAVRGIGGSVPFRALGV